MPEGWFHKPSETSEAYFENEEGTKGLYVKAIDLPAPKANASHVAKLIQDVHLSSFTEGTTNSWRIADQRLSTEGDLARSALDIYDAAANYRVLSLVLSTADGAIQVTVHDYWCEDYEATRGDFVYLESSIMRAASAP